MNVKCGKVLYSGAASIRRINLCKHATNLNACLSPKLNQIPLVASNELSSRHISTPCSQQTRWLHLSAMQSQKVAEEVEEAEEGEDGEMVKKGVLRTEHDVETSINYLQSQAYQITYGNKLVWEPYKRNHKGPYPPPVTRKTCVRAGMVATGNPCPLCRDEYLVLHPKNVELLKQFVSSYSGEVLSYKKTGICQKKYKDLIITVQQAWDQGYLDIPIAHRSYDYADYYPALKETTK